MANLNLIRRRIKSARNISQITKAMEMVSASKMKKAQDQALASRPFADKLTTVIDNIASLNLDYTHPLSVVRKDVKNVALITVNTNKGLCGSLNVNIFREISNWANTLPSDASLSLITLGKKAKKSVPSRDSNLLAKYDDISENPTFEEVRAIATMVMDGYLKEDFDQVFVVYPKFISTLTSETTFKQLLPLQSLDLEEGEDEEIAQYLIEPQAKNLLDYLVPYFIEMNLYQTVLEARASEHSARMVAMKNASDNAKELIHNLTLDYNQARQNKVTSELLDVTSARKALED